MGLPRPTPGSAMLRKLLGPGKRRGKIKPAAFYILEPRPTKLSRTRTIATRSERSPWTPRTPFLS
jgi:hypothetical protein